MFWHAADTQINFIHSMIITMQSSLFQQSDNLLPKDGHVVIYPSAINANFENLKDGIAWKHEKIKLFGRWVLQPRLTAWYGDEGTDYVYSGLKNTPNPWNPTLLNLKDQVEDLSNTKFNSVLINYYRDGQDSMGWHQDNEKALGLDPTIASLTFGTGREFHLRHKFDKSVPTVKSYLENESLLIMSGTTQQFWQHQVPKTKKPIGERINLTFRKIIK